MSETTQPQSQNRPSRLKILFTITSMPVGGAETLLVNLVRRLDRERFAPELCCLKELGPLGEVLATEIPTHHGLLKNKYDLGIAWRLSRLMQDRRIDAVVTVGAGDKMFWGRLAARLAKVPVVCSALHSTGWPDGVGRLNRLLTPITDAFIGVAEDHGRFLVEFENFPEEKVHVIPNGVDIQRFRPYTAEAAQLRHDLGIPADAPVCGIVAALRPEKNHELFLQVAANVHQEIPNAHFVIVGQGPQQLLIESHIREHQLESRVHLLGNRCDVPQVLSMLDVFMLTSHNEANPVSILEAMAVGMPVVSTNVGSIHQAVESGITGLLADAGDAEALTDHLLHLFRHPEVAASMSVKGRRRVKQNSSLEVMVQGYEDLIYRIYQRKCGKAQTMPTINEGNSVPQDHASV